MDFTESKDDGESEFDNSCLADLDDFNAELADSDSAEQVQEDITQQQQPALPELLKPFPQQHQQQHLQLPFQAQVPMIPFQQQQPQQSPFFQAAIHTSQASYVHVPTQLPQYQSFPNYAALGLQGFSSPPQPLFSGPFQNLQAYDYSGYQQQQQMQMLPQQQHHYQMHPPPPLSASAAAEEPPLKKLRPSFETITAVISSRQQSPSQWEDLSRTKSPSTGSKFFSQSDANALEALFSESELRNGRREIAMVSQGQFDTKDFKLYKIEDYLDETKNLRTLRFREIKKSIKEVSFPMEVNMQCWNTDKCKCDQHAVAYLKSINFQVVRKAIGGGMLFVVKGGYIY
jgi:hypothetical protein